MKQLLAILGLIFTTSAAFGQKVDCHYVHEGKFKVTDTSGTTIITRTGNEQTEENPVTKSKMVFTVSWINNCMYELHPKEVISGDQALMGKEGDYLTVIIKDIKATSYTTITLANFTTAKLEREIELVR